MKFPNDLKDLRIKRGWSQKYVMKRVGYKSQPHYSSVENGKIRPHYRKMAQFSLLYGKPIPEIFYP